MATNTFDRKICIQNPNAARRLSRVLNNRDIKPSDLIPPYTDEERARSEDLLKQLLTRSAERRQ